MAQVTDSLYAEIQADNQKAFARLISAKPMWTNVLSAQEAVGLPDYTLLHAGPPYRDPTQPAAPVLSSAILACLYEGWAKDEDEAQALIRSEKVKLYPAQSYSALMPLAAVASPRSTLIGVTDQTSKLRSWSLLGSGAGPQLRFGTRDLQVLAKLHWRDEILGPAIKRALKEESINLLELAIDGLTAGDDLHASTAHAQHALTLRLAPLLVSQQADDSVKRMLDATPLFFLSLWMAACDTMLSAAAAHGENRKSSLIVAIAGNGQDLGMRVAGQPQKWFTMPGRPPAGPYFNKEVRAPASNIVGDSGVIDAAGFGAQAFHLAPSIAETFADYLPNDWLSRSSRLMLAEHPFIAGLKIRTGMDASALVEPLAAIAMLGADGTAGLLGRGILSPGGNLFAQIMQSIKNMT